MFRNKVEVLSADELLRVHLTDGKCAIVDDTPENRMLLATQKFSYSPSRGCPITHVIVRNQRKTVSLGNLVLVYAKHTASSVRDPSKHAIHPKYFDESVAIDPLEHVLFVAKQQ